MNEASLMQQSGKRYVRAQRGVKRQKRNHSVKCLKCLKPFLSYNLKTNRICTRCKQGDDWKSAEDYSMNIYTGDQRDDGADDSGPTE